MIPNEWFRTFDLVSCYSYIQYGKIYTDKNVFLTQNETKRNFGLMDMRFADRKKKEKWKKSMLEEENSGKTKERLLKNRQRNKKRCDIFF